MTETPPKNFEMRLTKWNVPGMLVRPSSWSMLGASERM